MALPGGRRDPADRSLLDTAIRETREETAVDLGSAGRLLGRLETVAPRSPQLPPLTVVPFVFTLTTGVQARPLAGEVAEVVWTPLERFRNPASRATYRHPEYPLAFPAFSLGDRMVWGLTHRILEDFLARMR
jgi:8-oxo-dGTP pyrophosphatase MutT (NUDIX family)